MSNMYEFFLPNIDFGSGDQMTVGQVSANGHECERKVCDRIDFEIGGRKWCLRKLGILGGEDLPMDVAFAKAKAMGDEHAKIELSPCCVLQVESDGFTPDAASAIADDLCWLLHIALGQKAWWRQLVLRDGIKGKLLGVSGAMCADQPSKNKPVPNGGNGELKLFLESAYPIYATAPGWWRVTADWFAVAIQHSAIQAAGLTCSMLLDRATEFLLKGLKFPKQIDEGLGAKLAENGADRVSIVADLNQAFLKITEKWTEERSQKILGMVLQWNSAPPYEQKVARAFELVGLPAPEDELLAHRNSLAHNGQLKTKGTPVDKYYARITDVVTTLLLRMLAYKGPYFVLGVGEKTL